MPPAKKDRRLNIFNVLSRISTKDREYYNALEDSERKELQPFVVMRWLTGTDDARQLYFINELVNRFVFDFTHHKELMYDLMCVATSGNARRYRWMKTASRKGAKLPTAIDIIKRYFRYNTREAHEVLPILTNDQVMEFAEDLGLQKEEISKLKRELKTRDGKI